MGAIYRFDLVGANGSTMGGHVCGDYTVDQALAWAFEDLESGRAIPIEIIRPFEDGGGVAYDVCQIRAAFVERPLPETLLARLAAVGGACMTPAPGPWGSYEILTPAHASSKYIWCSPLGLISLLDEWEAHGGYHPRLALIFMEAAKEARASEARAAAARNETT